MRRLSGLLASCLLLVGCMSAPEAHRPVTQPAIITRAAWGSTPEPIPEERRHTPHLLTLHHAGVVWKPGDEGLKKVRGLQAFGQREKGWPDLPYHYLITPKGEIYEGRPIAYAGETNTEYDPSGHALVQLFGNFEVQRVQQAQLEAAVELVAWLCHEHRIDPATISGHRDHSTQTVCPGADLQHYISSGAFRAWVEERLAGKTPIIHQLPPVGND